MNDSSTGGYLQAGAPEPVTGQSWEDFLQQVIAGIVAGFIATSTDPKGIAHSSSITPQYVIPRWQLEPGNMPPVGTDFIGFGETEADYEDGFPAVLHSDPNNAVPYSSVDEHEIATWLLSFYGPNADTFMRVFRAGINISQNREVLVLNGVGHMSTGRAMKVPDLMKDRWLNRVDLPWRLRRQVLWQYPILDIYSLNVVLNNEYYLTQIPPLPLPGVATP